MKTTAIALSRLRLATGPNLAARLPDFIALTKPRVMALAVFTALVGLVMAPSRLDPLLGSVAVLAIAVGAGAAGVLNMWYDADIDAVMTRTAGRPIPRGAISRLEALAFGLVLQRRRCSCFRSQYHSRGAARICHLLLRRRLYDVAQAYHSAEYRDRWCCRRASTPHRLGGGKGRDCDRAADPVPDRVPVDAASLLGAVAHSR